MFTRFKCLFPSFSLPQCPLNRDTDNLWDCPNMTFMITFRQSKRWYWYRNFSVYHISRIVACISILADCNIQNILRYLKDFLSLYLSHLLHWNLSFEHKLRSTCTTQWTLNHMINAEVLNYIFQNFSVNYAEYARKNMYQIMLGRPSKVHVSVALTTSVQL